VVVPPDADAARGDDQVCASRRIAQSRLDRVGFVHLAADQERHAARLADRRRQRGRIGIVDLAWCELLAGSPQLVAGRHDREHRPPAYLDGTDPERPEHRDR
jgi:hypothetical protein